MTFGAFAMSRMVLNFTDRTEALQSVDKITISSSQHEAEDPFYYTGYQAYMFAWHMDEFSYEDLYWIGGSFPHGLDKIDSTSDKHVRIGTLTPPDLNGKRELMGQFYVWRNQMITGAGNGAERSVKKTVASLVPQSDLPFLYKGTYKVADPSTGAQLPLGFHLELTDEFQVTNDLEVNDYNAGGKIFKWMLVPKTIPSS